jgi:hypothetical protein
MIIGRATRVPEGVRTLRDFVVGALNLRSYGVSPGAIDDLVDEIWNAPANANLQKVPREHRGGSMNGDLEVAPDEWVYLPFAPPADYKVRSIQLTGAETSEDQICEKIRAQFGEVGMDFPGGHLTPADLENVLFNSALRTGLTPTEAYFYVIPSLMITTDVAPITDATQGAPTVGKAQATPDWLLPLWHWIDRLHFKSEQHSAVLQDLFDLCSEGKMMAMALTTVEKFLTVLERECKAPPATSVLERIAQAYDPAGHLFNISDFHTKLTALRDAAQHNYVDNCTFPLLGPFRTSCEELRKLDSDPDYLDVYNKFDKVRSRYPVTEHALQMVLAFYLACRGFTPEGEDFAAKIDKAVQGSPDQTPLFLEIANVLKATADNVVSPTAAIVGNAPGPLSMLVAFGKLHLLWQLKTPATAVVSVEQYIARVAKLAGVPAEDIAAEVAASGVAGRNARLFMARVQATELAASGMQASARWMKAVSFLDAVVFVSATCSTIGDIKSKGWLDASTIADGSGAASAGAGAVAAVLQLRLGAKQSVVLALKQAGKIDASKLLQVSVDKLAGITKVCGKLVAFFGLVSGVMQIWQGIRDKDGAEKWGGIGTVLVSLQMVLDFFFSRYAAQVGARVAVILAEVVAEETAIAVGSAAAAVLAGAGAVIAGIGVIIVLVCIIYKNREAIQAFLEHEATPGPARACAAYLKAVESSRAYSVGAGAVKTALRQASDALPYAFFVNYMPPDRVKAELKAAGMSDEDLRVISAFAPLSVDAMARASAAPM